MKNLNELICQQNEILWSLDVIYNDAEIITVSKEEQIFKA